MDGATNEREAGREDAGQHPTHRLAQNLVHKIRLWFDAVAGEPYYFFGETGNILFTVGKNILDGAVLYTMFSMAETELRVAAILGILTKYLYPGISVVSSIRVSSFIDRVETIRRPDAQVQKLIRGLSLVALGEAVAVMFLIFCYPPFFKGVFGGLAGQKYVLIFLFLLHHICDGSAQIVEGRIWFKLIEIKIRHGASAHLAVNFWGIHAISQNAQLIIGQVLLWSTTIVAGVLHDRLDRWFMLTVVLTGFTLACTSKLSLPLAYRWRLCRSQP